MRLRSWTFRLAFPALGLLLVLMFFGISAPEAPVADEVKADSTESFEGMIPTPTPEKGPNIVFKWRDSKGSLHYADKPPSKGRWSALALDPGAVQITPPSQIGANQGWKSNYSAPFSLSADGIHHYNNAATP